MKNDFADWLSPMLVKELRQGVRSRMFLSTFILLQITMLLTMVGGLLSAGDGSAASGTVFFWVLVGLSVLVILPMSGITAIGGEIKANTLELIFLTRLSSLRIVAGKWLAIFAVSVLLVTAVLPYLVLRYFMGGVNVTTEMIALFSLLAASALLTAVTVGLSSYQTRVARWVLGLVLLFALQGGLPFFFFARSSSPVAGLGIHSSWQWIYFIADGAIFLFLMLDVGASKIAPAAENHSGIQRALVLGVLALAWLAKWSNGDARTLTILAIVLAAPVCAVALCEQPRWISSLHRPFAARGLPGRWLGRLLYPGWHTAVRFTTVMFVAFAALLALLKMLDGVPAVVRLVAVFGSLLLPVALTRLFFPQTQKPLAIFFVVQLVCLLPTIILGMIDAQLKTSLRHFDTFLPLCALMQSVEDEQLRSRVAVIGVPLVTAASWVALLVLSHPLMKRTRALEKESLQTVLPDGSLA